MTIPGSQQLLSFAPGPPLLPCSEEVLARYQLHREEKRQCCHPPGCRGQKSLEPGLHGSPTQVSPRRWGGEAEFRAPPLLPPNRNSPPGAARVASQLSSFQCVTLNGAHTKSTEALCSAHGNERVAVAVFNRDILVCPE